MRGIAIAALVASCGYSTPSAITGDEGGPSEAGVDAIDAIDAPPDAPIDAPPAVACFGDFTTMCLAALPGQQLSLNGTDTLILDTDTSPLCEPVAEGSQVDACVVVGTSVQIDGTISARGSRPLVVIAT